MEKPGLNRAEEAVGSLLREAGAIALRELAHLRPERKSDGSVVTAADRLCEAHLVEGLSALFPNDAVVGEEGASTSGSSGATWYVDPLDGTAAYVEGLAYWGPTVCRVVEGRYDAGWLYLPRLDEMYLAKRGGGAWRNGARLRAGDAPVDGDASICLPSRFHRRMPLPWPGRVRAVGSTAAHLALVASGSAIATVIPSFQPWDVGCGFLLVSEAGRRVETAEGHLVEGPETGSHLPVLAGAPTALRVLRGRLRRKPAAAQGEQQTTE